MSLAIFAECCSNYHHWLSVHTKNILHNHRGCRHEGTPAGQSCLLSLGVSFCRIVDGRHSLYSLEKTAN